VNTSNKILSVAIWSLLVTVSTWSAGPPKPNTLSGKWSGTNDTRACKECSKNSHPLYVILNEKGQRLTGSAGPSELQQHPFHKGEVYGNVVTFQIPQPANHPYRPSAIYFNLTLKGSELKGKARWPTHKTVETGAVTLHRIAANTRRGAEQRTCENQNLGSVLPWAAGFLDSRHTAR
jgi:hypothetical protein